MHNFLLKTSKKLVQRKSSVLREKFVQIKNQGLVDLLDGMLQFNPDFRFTAKESLEHSVFKKVRSLMKERECPESIYLSIYSEAGMDYATKTS